MKIVKSIQAKWIKKKQLTMKVKILKMVLMPNFKLKVTKGFTLIELLVVISIIAILLAVATVSYTNSQEKGRDSRRKSDLKAVQQALELYFQQNGKYPANSTSGNAQIITCNLTGDTGARNWGSEFYCDPTGTPDPPRITYMNPLPKDPTNTSSTPYYYLSASPHQSYKIYAKLENPNDKDLTTTPSACSSGTVPGSAWQTGGLYYCVINP